MEKPHKRLKAWQLGMDIAVDIYKASERFPSEERFGLTSQMRKCGVSIPSNTCPVKQLEVLLYYTYVLQSFKDMAFYTGFTKNLKLRFEEHNKGIVESTKNRGPFKLIYYEVYPIKWRLPIFNWGMSRPK